MGDGYLHKRDKIYNLHTEGFTYNECLIISKELNEKFNLNSKVKISRKTKSKDLYKIVFNKKDTKLIMEIIKPYIINIFEYKIK